VFAFSALSVWIAGVGCSSSDEGGAADAATSTDSGAASDSSSSSDAGGGTDTSTATDTGAATDTGSGGDGGGAIAYLQECKTVGTPGDCAPGLTCKLFAGKQKNFCTKPCTKATAATDCPAPAKGCGGDNFCSPP
jgi:hypothetical protein